MGMLGNQTKSGMLLTLFDKVGTRMALDEVCELTGIKGYNSLKAFLSYIRKSEHVAEKNRIDIRIKSGFCTRVQ
jgi:hypothetical protein